MTIAERIKRIASKANVSYSAIKLIVYGQYGKHVDDDYSFENKLKLLEKQYGIQ